MFEPIVTDRLVIRSFVPSDVESLLARRNDPHVARYQNWEYPFPRSQAEAIVESLVKMEGPTDAEWWMASVCDRLTGEVLGDLATELTWSGRSAEVGYNIDHRHWGKGYAAEATHALVNYLFEVTGVTRVFGMLHPDNIASAMVLERSGLVFEGHTKLSYWDVEGPSDDWIYGTTDEEWRRWRDRKRIPPRTVRLVPVSTDNAGSVARLVTHRSQRRYVAPIRASYMDALFPKRVDGAPVVPIMRAIEADDELVGFVMLAATTEHHPEPFLWRFLIDRMHQRRGIGTLAMAAVVDERRALGDSTIITSWTEGKGSPSPFFVGLGFVPTERLIDGEVEARLTL
jgi:RimJ/RimL family protein N-acetyltransferase